MRLCLLIEYDGTRYAGWQIQKGLRTIQGEIEAALNKILHESIRVIGAGRTDSGVHARGQIAHFDVQDGISFTKLQQALNGLLDKDIRIKDVQKVNAQFHARYSAINREYNYIIAKIPLALYRKYSWYVPCRLNVTRMQEGVSYIRGRQDFTSFCRKIAKAKHYQCTVDKANWIDEDEILRFIIKSDRFLHGMVRALVGTLVDIGRGKLSPSDMKKIMEKRDRIYASQSAPAQGLILDRIYY
jgi:tRNA pseudouridine38-40 synthase